MKNLFDYATKELSQDAFLRWLFESYENDDIKPCVRKLLKEFCGIDEGAEITKMKTRSQWEKIDIEVDLLANGERYLLYIEDKTWSQAHDQLKKYGVAISEKAKKENIKEKNIKKIFYKTYWISEKDKSETEENGWTTYDINAIYDFFKPFYENSNVILNQYVKHIEGIYNALHNTTKPADNEPENYLNWEGYFNYISKSIIDEHNYKDSGAWKAGPYPYVCLVLRKQAFTPYLEIQSRDCVDNKFEAVILCYGLDDQNAGSTYKTEEIAERQKPLIDKIGENGGIFSSKHTINNFKGYKKQLGRYKSERKIETNEDFIEELEKCACYYDKLMNLWNT